MDHFTWRGMNSDEALDQPCYQHGHIMNTHMVRASSWGTAETLQRDLCPGACLIQTHMHRVVGEGMGVGLGWVNDPFT